MQESNLEENKIVEPYSIGRERFEIEPTELKKYSPGDKITRENFCNFLMCSFGISRGHMEVQVQFMQWLKLHTGFDYVTTLNNFIAVGGWDRLSDNEKEEFINEFRKIAKHSQEYEEKKLEDDIRDEMKDLEDYASQLAHINELSNKEMKNIKTFAEFSAFARKEIERLVLEREENAKLRS